jgi:predicted AlkP superfamily pyrophosphatase or phosphodiesterase
MSSRRSPWITALFSITLGVALTAVWPTPARDFDARPGSAGTPAVTDVVRHACSLEEDELVRIWRGYDSARSEDVIVVPREPNYVGSFDVASHTGPWDYVQEVPLVFYGPRFVPERGLLPSTAANLTDVYPTLGELLQTKLPPRDGVVLKDALLPRRRSKPRLVLVIVWDGVGRNVLQRWPGRWPTLTRIEAAGVSYGAATVGSSPSITPASHTTIGTGAWPRRHRVTAIKLRLGGSMTGAFNALDPRMAGLSTVGDEVDAAFDNRSKVGLVAWQPWHLGMLGHGRGWRGGDADLVALIGPGGGVEGNDDFYFTPGYLDRMAPGLRARAPELDRTDGALDGRWRGRDVLIKQSPAWIAHETDVILEILSRGDFGRDVVPDLLFVNYKMTDIAGHQDSMESVEMAEALEAQDAALHRILAHLETKVRSFVVVVTADHGHTPSRESTGAWPIDQDELVRDIDRRFGVPAGNSLIAESHAAGLWLDDERSPQLGVDGEDVAVWLNGYSIQQNWSGVNLPRGYEHRGQERILDAAFPGDRLDDILLCKFGSRTPPPGARG